MTTSARPTHPIAEHVEMIRTLRGDASQASSIRHAKRLLSPSTLRHRRRFNCASPVFRRPYWTQNAQAAPLESGPAASTDERFTHQGYTVVKGGFGDEDEDTRDPLPAHINNAKPKDKNQKHAGAKSSWGELRQVKPEESATTNSEDLPPLFTLSQGNEDVSLASAPWLSTLEDDQGDPTAAPENTFERTSTEDVIALCSETPWEIHGRYGFLERGFELCDFHSARALIIEALELKDSLNARLCLSNYGRHVYVRVGAAEANAPRWSLSDEDVDICWALQKAAKKYIGKRLMDASLKPDMDHGYSDSWVKPIQFTVPSSKRWHHVLDLRRPPMSWLTMEYRQLSGIGIPPTGVAVALLDQIAQDLLKLKKRNGVREMAFPVWCITDQTLAVSQTEFFCLEASITNPGAGPLKIRDTVMLHRNFNLEQFNAMVAKENASLKDVKDSACVGILLKSVTNRWRLSTSKREIEADNCSGERVYLREWGPFLTKELQPQVRRILIKSFKKHDQHIEALPNIYSPEAILNALDERFRAAPQEKQSTTTMAWNSAGSKNADTGQQQASKSTGYWTPKGFDSLVNMLRKRVKDSKIQDPGGHPGVKGDQRPEVSLDDIESEKGKAWQERYLGLRGQVERNQQARQSQQAPVSSPGGSSLNAELVELLSRVSYRRDHIDWRERYYELRRSATSLDLLGEPAQWEDGQISQVAQQQQDAQHKNQLESDREGETDSSFVWYHWLPGEKLQLDAIHANQNQTWRPNAFKQFVTRDAMYGDGPAANDAPEALVDTPNFKGREVRRDWHPDENYARPLLESTKIVHWLPGDKFYLNKRGVMATPPKRKKPQKAITKRRRRLQEGAADPEARPQENDQPRPYGTMRLGHDPSFWDSFSNIEPEAEAETGSKLRPLRQWHEDEENFDVSKGAEAETQSPQGQHADTEPRPETDPKQRPQEPLPLSGETGTETGTGTGTDGLLSSEDAEKLLAEFGVETDESKGGASPDGASVEDGKKEGDVEAKSEDPEDGGETEQEKETGEKSKDEEKRETRPKSWWHLW